MKRPAGCQNAFALPESFHVQLDRYAAAATAAGVGMLALAQPSEAKIVYTPTHVLLAANQHYGIDFENNGTSDITLGRGAGEGATYVFASGRNGVAAQMDNHRFAVAIHAGAQIDFSRHFVQSSSFEPTLAIGSASNESSVKWRGQWADAGQGVTDRYLGVKFTSGGQVHFGWARITITIGDPNRAAITKVLLSGYAYETIPNKPIIAGKTTGSADDIGDQANAKSPESPSPQPATLGLLAAGAPAISIWRRKDSEPAAETVENKL